ncbi:hypothetical protein [Bacillus sp. (in: firmicutes)]|uniref:hypothetical protein n=1 Tax=Bacillus sp. TaxID=1409 RepID=UPI0028FE9936|nr:hypothetical protein [Bacillus sp. (in: firmicutes)]MDU2391862.1 hypothetical protein [Bacillus sp. (in: firmicutes)]
MNKKKYPNIKFEEVPSMIDSLRRVSGLYIFHTHGHIWYIGKAVDLHNRFITAYLKKGGTPAHVNEGLKQRIDAKGAMSVIFVPMSVELIEEEEKKGIRKFCPWFNDSHNPREVVNTIQVMAGEIVNNSNREWSYNEMVKHLWRHYMGQISSNRIDNALLSNWRISYCSRNNKKRILRPKKLA